MTAIVTLSLNSTIDGFATAGAIRPLRKIRTTGEHCHAGGGGIIVARVIGKLGCHARVIHLARGPTRQILDDLLTRAKIDAARVAIAGTTRIAHTVFERVSGLEYRFTPEGSETSGEEWQNCLTALDGLEFDVLVVSGGLPVDACYRVIDIAALKNARVVHDTSGPAQEAAAPELVEAGSAEAAMTVAIVNRWSLHAALDYGVAAGAAAVIAPNDGGCRAVDVERRYAASRATRATFARWKR